MKIYLVLTYNKDAQGNVWADVQAYTSEKQRNAALYAISPDKDVEKQDIEVAKRSYNKRSLQVVQAFEAPVHE